MLKTDNSPPALPAPSSSPKGAVSRRELFRLGGMAGALAATPLAARGMGSGFTHGVASGEPSQDGVLLWTRFVGEADSVEYVLSESADLSTPVAGGTATVSAERDYCVKAEVRGQLQPGRWYFYQFIAPDGSKSDIGRTRTLPEGATDRFRLAVFSCSNFGFGWFNAYAHAAEADDADLALHLGDYIYEYGRGAYPSPEETQPGRMIWPQDEIVALADYRLRYATYRADRDLRRLHQIMPMICIWDDHESANDSWEGGAQNHQPESEGEWDVRKAVAKRVYREWMPVSDAPYASYEVGDLATLFRLDTRLEGREQQFDLGTLLSGAQSPDAAAAALTAFRDGDYANAERQLLGAAQEAWLSQGLSSSRGQGKTWQVLVQQVLMGKLSTPPSITQALTDDVPGYIRARITAAAMAGATGLPANMDAWDGYPAARERLLAASLNADANLLVLAGDTHNAWAFELDHGGAQAGVEFGVQAVTSPGLENSLQAIAPADFARSALAINDQLKWADTAQRGYMNVTLTPEMARSEYRFVATVKERSTRLAGTKTVTADAASRLLTA